MNFLDLTNRLKRKCGVTGAKITSLTNQVEEINKLIDSVNEAWMDIQLAREDWLWMRASAYCPTVAGKATYAPGTDFLSTVTNLPLTDHANWDTDTFRNYVTATGIQSEIRTDFIEYDKWRDTYQFGANRLIQTRPIEITVTPSLSIGVGPSPAAGYTITGDYFKVASELVLAADIPAMPAQFHMAIIYRAMMFIGASEAATEVYSEGKDEWDRMRRMLILNQINAFSVGGPLA